MKSILLKSLVSIMATTLATGVFAAGSHDDGHGDSAVGQSGDAGDVSRTIEVSMRDNYFDPETISVAKGETVRFVVRNEGSLVHEFNIGTASMHEAHQQEMQTMVEHGVLKDDHIDREMMDMGNGQSMKHDDPNSVLLELGQSEEIIWTFSEATGLEFACNVPGHYQAGMVGNIDIE